MSANNWGRLRLDCENVIGSTLDPNCRYDSADWVKRKRAVKSSFLLWLFISIFYSLLFILWKIIIFRIKLIIHCNDMFNNKI